MLETSPFASPGLGEVCAISTDQVRKTEDVLSVSKNISWWTGRAIPVNHENPKCIVHFRLVGLWPTMPNEYGSGTPGCVKVDLILT